MKYREQDHKNQAPQNKVLDQVIQNSTLWVKCPPRTRQANVRNILQTCLYCHAVTSIWGVFSVITGSWVKPSALYDKETRRIILLKSTTCFSLNLAIYSPYDAFITQHWTQCWLLTQDLFHLHRILHVYQQLSGPSGQKTH